MLQRKSTNGKTGLNNSTIQFKCRFQINVHEYFTKKNWRIQSEDTGTDTATSLLWLQLQNQTDVKSFNIGIRDYGLGLGSENDI